MERDRQCKGGLKLFDWTYIQVRDWIHYGKIQVAFCRRKLNLSSRKWCKGDSAAHPMDPQTATGSCRAALLEAELATWLQGGEPSTGACVGFGTEMLRAEGKPASIPVRLEESTSHS